MKVVALISGGKDSCYNMMQCVAEGHDIVALANLRPRDKDEIDSYMFQTVGHHAIDLYAEAMGLPLFRRTIEGGSLAQGRDYTQTAHDEVEDMFALLKQVRDEVGVQGVSVGAVLSDYQRVRVENVCSRLGLTSLAYLWRRDQAELLNEMIQCNVDAIIIKVAALGLDPDKHLKKTLREIQPHMLSMKSKYGLNVCGEGGEYETFTLDCPLFKKKIVIDEAETVIHSADAFAPVGYINFKKMFLAEKNETREVKTVLDMLPMTRSVTLTKELFTEQERDSFGQPAVPPACVQCIQNRIHGSYVQKTRSINGWVFITGVLAQSAEGVSIEDSTEKTMDLLSEHLQSMGLRLSDVVAMHLYIQNMQNFGRINQVYKSYFSLNPPMRICVEAGLPSNILFQLDCIGCKSSERRTMHVQGLSHWAPANIGPYSQSVKIGDKIFVAGQIAMIPANLSIIPGGILTETRLSLRHVRRILEATQSGSSLHDLILVVCYVTKQEYISTAASEWKRAMEACKNEATQNDVSHDDAVGADPIVQYVVIPALPKGAIIEWQVVASLNCRHRIGRGIQKRYNGYMTETTYITRQDTDLLLAFRILLELETVEPKTDERTIKEYLEAVISAASDCVTRANHHSQAPVPALPSLRVLYRQDIIGLETLSKVYEGMRRISDGLPCIAFVPAANFDSNNCVLSSSSTPL